MATCSTQKTRTNMAKLADSALLFGGFRIIIWSQKVWGGGRKFDLVLLAIAVEVTADMSMNIKPKEGFQRERERECVCV